MDDQSNAYHMTPDEFRHHGHQVIEWVARYMEEVESMPVTPDVHPFEIYRAFSEAPPTAPESFDQLLREFEQKLLPGLMHWQSPNFFGYFPANASGPSILGELLSAALGVQGMLWSTSPACTELEMRVLDWLVEMLGLPRAFRFAGGGGGVIQDSASSATLCALLAARERKDPLAAREGCKRRLTVYATEHAHSSLDKAVRIAGLGSAALRRVPCDEGYAMRPEALAQMLREDSAAGDLPCMVLATIGTTSSNAVDPIEAIGEACQQAAVWLHVDAAMSGTAGLCEELRDRFTGLSYADSYCFNPHKWMFTNFDCDCFWVRDRSALEAALFVDPEYLRAPSGKERTVVDYRNWQIPLGRRFRALKLFFVIKHYGVEGLKTHIRQHVALARWLADQVAGHPRLELSAPVPFNLVTFRHREGDEASERLLASVNRRGRVFLTHTRLDGRFTLRVAVGQTHTQRRHVEALWSLIAASCSEL